MLNVYILKNCQDAKLFHIAILIYYSIIISGSSRMTNAKSSEMQSSEATSGESRGTHRK